MSDIMYQYQEYGLRTRALAAQGKRSQPSSVLLCMFCTEYRLPFALLHNIFEPYPYTADNGKFESLTSSLRTTVSCFTCCSEKTGTE